MNFILMLAIWRLEYRTIKNSSTVSGVGDPCIFVYARQKLKKNQNGTKAVLDLFG